ncbi:MAG TPA: sulfite exporter TauE/SafE family protein [Candidatus Omnitrophota bacterium]|nr:sulfite exporter TauE/SafE family protein [Candidatus Omnitrophota bacterium]
MKESLYYLFLSGLILGCGPCLGFCAPILTGFIATYKPSLKKALGSYLSFSLAKLASYMILGALCGVFSGMLKSSLFTGYLDAVNIVLGSFVLLIGILTLISNEPLGNRYCSFLARGNLRNAGILGLLAGFSPCLPFLGILDYIVIISHSPPEGLFYAFIFGLGTSISPVILIALLSGKLAGDLSNNKKIKALIRIISSLTLICLGAIIILQKLIR